MGALASAPAYEGTYSITHSSLRLPFGSANSQSAKLHYVPLRTFDNPLVSINLNNEIIGRRKDKKNKDQPLKKKEMRWLKTEE